MFLIRPRPFDAESLSSWRQRGAVENGFWRYPQPSGYQSGHDIDRLPTVIEQQWISTEFNLGLNHVVSMALETILLPIQRQNVFSPRWRWATSMGSRSNSSSHGPMCCPLCLQADPIPYFRIHWRFAFLTECPVHKTEMINQCPGCGGPIWPASFGRLTKSRCPQSASVCICCGFDLRNQVANIPSELSQSEILWNTIVSGNIPDSFKQVKSLPDFFDGVWVICQLLIRSQSSRLLNFVPASITGASDAGGPHRTIEGCSITERRRLINSALWLIDEWPGRFLDCAARVGISRTHFISTVAANPSWLTEVVDKHLTRRSPVTTIKDVEDAIHVLEEREEPVSKSAVRRVLGVTESKAANEILFRREVARVDELLCILRKFEQRLCTSPHSRDQYATSLRDYLIFLLSVLRQDPVEQVCRLSEREVTETLGTDVDSHFSQAETAKVVLGRARNLNAEYRETVRPHLTSCKTQGPLWFLGRAGLPFAGHPLRERISKMMRDSFREDLWRSADVFQHTLGSPKFGRRALSLVPKPRHFNLGEPF